MSGTEPIDAAAEKSGIADGKRYIGNLSFMTTNTLRGHPRTVRTAWAGPAPADASLDKHAPADIVRTVAARVPVGGIAAQAA